MSSVTKKPAPKKSTSKKAAAAKAPKGPGVIASIVEYLSAASDAKPLSKQALCDKLAKRFPDRSPDSMMKTIQVQIPGRLSKERKVVVKQNDNGFWIK